MAACGAARGQRLTFRFAALRRDWAGFSLGPMLRALALAPLLSLAALPAASHPHVFIEAGLDFVLDEAGQLIAVDVTWIYDELYSLILIEDQQLDPDGDGELTPEELAILAKQDQDWSADYEGDLYGQSGGARLELAAPVNFGLDYADGKLISSHRRPLAAPVDPAAEVIFKTYDPFFYAAFDVTLPVRVVATVSGSAVGAECRAEVTDADYEAASAKAQELIKAAPQDTIEMDFPMVGEDFADTVRLLCGG